MENQFDPTKDAPIPANVLAAAAAADKAQLDHIAGKTVEPAAEPDPVSKDPVVIPQPTDELKALKHKLDVLQGKYDKEVPRLSEQLKEAGEQITRANEIIARQNEIIASAKAAPTENIEAPEINPEDYDAFGPEVAALARAYNSLAAKVKTSPDIARITERIDTVAKNQAATAFERFRSDAFGIAARATGLTADVIDRIDASDDDFKAWLSEEYGFSGSTRGQFLDAAAEAMDAHRAAKVFISYVNEKGIKPGGKKPGLESQVVAPTGAGSGSEPRPSHSNELESARAKYLQANDDFLKGRITEKEHDAITATYQNAIQRAQAAA